MIPEARLDQIVKRHAALSEQMAGNLGSEEFVKVSREYAELDRVVAAINRQRKITRDIADLEQMLADPGADAEMKELAAAELAELREQLPAADHDLKIMLLPKDSADDKSAILEIRAGTGGDEAALFAGDLYNMYKRYAELKGWKWELLSASETDLGGFKEVVASVSGPGVFARLKYESGGHRVQRVPDTETQGRIHTSAATVAVLPEAEEVDIKIEDKDLRIDVFRASGPGGQSVNTTDSAVRITHLPTGLVVSQQDEKSQHKNRAKGMKILRARLYEMERDKINSARAAERKGQIGSGDRSERIRTYNFPQGRVTEHRINLTLYKIEPILMGEALDEIIDPLIAQAQAEQLAEMEGQAA